MCAYRERLRPPVSWWVLGLAAFVVLAPELVIPFSVTVAGMIVGEIVAGLIFAGLVGGWVAVLLAMGRFTVAVTDTELQVGNERLPLADVGEVTPLTDAQTRELRGNAAAQVLMRPYLHRAVCVQLRDPAEGPPYWLVGTRAPADLAAAVAAALGAARSASEAGKPAVG